MSANKRDWNLVTASWFRNASTSELREFVEAVDADMIADNNHKEELYKAFKVECDRRSGSAFEKINNGEWI